MSRWFLARERQEIPDLLFRQEWLGEFVETGAAVFRQVDIDAMFSSDIRPLFGDETRDAYAASFHGAVAPLDWGAVHGNNGVYAVAVGRHEDIREGWRDVPAS